MKLVPQADSGKDPLKNQLVYRIQEPKHEKQVKMIVKFQNFCQVMIHATRDFHRDALTNFCFA